MPLFPLDTVRNARIDQTLEPILEDLRDTLRHVSLPDGFIATTEDMLEVFDSARPRLNVLLSLVREGGCRTAVDISTGLGFLPVLLRRMGIEVVATECDPEIAAFPRALGIEVLSYCIGRGPLPLDPESLDLVVFAEVLEHLKRPPIAVIREVTAALRPGGSFLLTTPNVARLAHIESLVAGENFLEPYPEDVPPHVDPTDLIEHVREYSVREIVDAVEGAGLAVDSVLMTGWGDGGYILPANPFVADICVVAATK